MLSGSVPSAANPPSGAGSAAAVARVPDPSERRFGAWAALLLLLVVFVTYGRALGNGLVYDDHWLVERNAMVRTLDPLTHLGQPFWSRWEKVGEYYRPLASYSIAVDHAVYGERPLGFHLTNLLLHVANAFLLLRVARGFAGRGASLVAALLFAVHPIQSEAVVWVLGRTDLLATGFVLLAAWRYLEARRRDARGLRVDAWVGLAAAGALLSKESAIALPAVLLGVELGFQRRPGQGWTAALAGAVRRLGRLGPIGVVVGGGYLLLRQIALGRLVVSPGAGSGATWDNPLFGEGLTVRCLTAVEVAGRYLGLVVWPRALSPDYRPEVVSVVRSLGTPGFLISLATLVAAIALVALAARRSPLGTVGGVVAVGAYLPVSHLLFAAPVIMAERMAYLPMVGIALLAGGGFELAAASRRPWSRRLALGLAGLALCGLGARGYARTGDWKDDLTLFRAASRVAPRSVLVWTNLGSSQISSGELGAALDSFARALAIRPDYLPARLNHASTLERLGRLEQAEAELVGVLEEFPTSGKALFQLLETRSALAARLADAGRVEAARAMRERIVEQGNGPQLPAFDEVGAGVDAAFRLLVARNLAELGRTEEAQAAFARAIERAEEDARHALVLPETGSNLLGAVLSESAAFERALGRRAEAGERFRRAALAVQAARDPRAAARLWLEAARELSAAGRQEAALDACERTLELAGTEAELVEEARVTRARALARGGDLTAAIGRAASARELLAAAEGAMESGRSAEAIEIYDRVLGQEPRSARALHGRARARLARGQLDLAEQDFEAMLETEPSGRPLAAVWTDLARVSLARGEPLEALTRLNRALDADREYAEARFRRGVVLLDQGRAAEAEADLLVAVRAGMPPGATAEAWFRLAGVAAMRGDPAEARRRVALSLEADPGHAGAQALEQRIPR